MAAGGRNRTLLKPPPLRPGERVGIIAPASDIDIGSLNAGCKRLVEMGYVPLYSTGIFDRDLYFAGSLQRRIDELHDMFVRDDVHAILCARGGYGSNYLLDQLDFELIRRHPKIFMGYSDITTMLTYLHDETGMATFHGPMVAKDFANDRVHYDSWMNCVSGVSKLTIGSDESGAFGLIDGQGEASLYGGCLSMLAASLGTTYMIDPRDTILFIEDVAAKPYQIDRMLMQLKLAGKFERVQGIIFGEMIDCVQDPNQPYTLQEVVRRVVGDLGVPVAFGFRSGHVSKANITLPLGVQARLTVRGENVTLELLEAAVATEGRVGNVH